LKENGEVSENSYFQESDFENILFLAAHDLIMQMELPKIRFSVNWAGI
jgi:hypothetical protein